MEEGKKVINSRPLVSVGYGFQDPHGTKIHGCSSSVYTMCIICAQPMHILLYTLNHFWMTYYT